MHGDQRFLAVIPARGGSKGIPRKNLQGLGHRPLIEYTIRAAMKSQHLDRVLVTSDDPEILDVALAAGAETVVRPDRLADDHAKSIDVVLHAIEYAGGSFDAVVLLQPTSPLRTHRHIDEAIELFVNSGRPVTAVSPAYDTPILLRTMDGESVLSPLLRVASTVRRQDMPDYWRVNGSIYVNPITGLTSRSSLNDNPVGYCMDAASGIDIDEPVDLAIAHWHLDRRSGLT